ncbi:MAG TPA: DNA repair protein RadC [Candidatus Saccharimonadales bacterium]|nr:DNA repair protein RadC [Candidatus Saccharimonadales bacterium]
MGRVRKMQRIPAEDRPREKLASKGVPALSDFELLEVVIGSGTVGADVSFIARKIQKLLLKGTQAVTLEALTAIKGVSVATAGKILASLELSRRHLVRDNTPLLSQADILGRLGDIRTKQQEYFVCISLDGGQRLIAQRTVTIGTLDSVIAHPREVFADAIVDRAASIVIAHNHPSGDPKPTQKDITLTQHLAAASQLLGIMLRDHIIVTKNNYFSFTQHHLLN